MSTPTNKTPPAAQAAAPTATKPASKTGAPGTYPSAVNGQSPQKPAAAAPAQAAAAAPQAAAPGGTRKLKKGEILFYEGETSRSMYFIKNGIIRIFKKKGDAAIEIGTVHSGEVIGELAFLDGNPRSASGEALSSCELVEISGPVFAQTLARTPDWLKILLKTVVGRLRAASTRIKQLESASSAVDYSDKDGGKQKSQYVFLSYSDLLKLSSAILLTGARNGAPASGGIILKDAPLQRYANQIMQIPLAKLTGYLDILHQAEIVRMTEATSETVLVDPDLLENFITYINNENLSEPKKRHDLTAKGYLVMSMIAKHFDANATPGANGFVEINIAKILKAETPDGGKEPFRLDDYEELVKIGYGSPVNIKNNDEMLIQVHSTEFMENFKFQRIVYLVTAVNDQKRVSASRKVA